MPQTQTPGQIIGGYGNMIAGLLQQWLGGKAPNQIGGGAGAEGVSLGVQWGPLYAMLLALLIAVVFAAALPKNAGVFVMALLLLGYLAVHPTTFENGALAIGSHISGLSAAISTTATITPAPVGGIRPGNSPLPQLP